MQVLVGPGDSPHSYEPSPKQMAALADAELYFSIGVEFEKAVLPRLCRMFAGLQVVDMRSGVPLREMKTAHTHEGHEHGGGHDPHIWLSPVLAKIQAQTIGEALRTADPQHAAVYQANLARFQAELDQVHGEIAAVLAPLKGQEVFVFPPGVRVFPGRIRAETGAGGD